MRAKRIGPYTQGEIPNPLVYTFKDRSGTAITLSGYTAVVELTTGGVTVELAAVVHANQTTNKGQVTWTPVDGDLEDAGSYTLQFWAGNGGTSRLAGRLFTFNVDRAVAPAI